MYCNTCHCEFAGWRTKCPVCRQELSPKVSDSQQLPGRVISQDKLVELIKTAGGQLTIDVISTDVGKYRKSYFPGFGFGYAWSKSMQGLVNGDIVVDLKTTSVGQDKSWNILCFGFGYAWIQKMGGSIGGLPFELKTIKIGKDRQFNILGFGYGFAWAAEMTGMIGHDIDVHLKVTEVSRHKEFIILKLGYGYAWERKAQLTLSLK